jgi:hypothetical protein
MPYGSANQVAYSATVAAQLGQVYLWDPSYALSQDPEAPEKQCRDLIIGGSLDHLQRSIVGHSFSFVPEENDKPGRALAKVIEQLTKKQRFFPQSLYNLSRATHRGAAWGRIYPERRVLKIGDGKAREWTIVRQVKDVDKRRFRLTQVAALTGAGGNLLSSTAGPSYASRSLVLARDNEDRAGFGSPLATSAASDLGNFRWEFYRGLGAPGSGNAGFMWTRLENAAPYDQWICHVTDTSEAGLGYGYALADELSFFFWLKGRFLQWVAQSAERFGQGFLVLTGKALRDGMAKGMNQAQALQATVNIIRTARAENYLALDENITVQMLDMPGEGMRWLFEWITYLDNGMKQRILAALQPTGSSSGQGGFSGAKVEEGSTDSQVSYLRSPLEETWTDTCVRYLVTHNEDNLRELGLWDLGHPRLSLKAKEQRDGELMLKWFEFALKAKIAVRSDDFYEASGLTAPNEEDEAIEWPEAAMQPGAGLDAGGLDLSGGERLPVGSGGSSVGESGRPGGPRVSARNGAAA